MGDDTAHLFNSHQGTTHMKTALLIAALAIAIPAMTATVYAQSADDKLAAACKDKNAGDKVMVDGQEMTCK
jgi:uncharacterized membrane protein